MLKMTSRALGSRSRMRRRSSKSRISGQIDVNDRDVGLEVEKGGETGRAVLRLKDLDVRLALQKRPAPRDDDRMVVDDENPHGPKSPLPDRRSDRPSSLPRRKEKKGRGGAISAQH